MFPSAVFFALGGALLVADGVPTLNIETGCRAAAKMGDRLSLDDIVMILYKNALRALSGSTCGFRDGSSSFLTISRQSRTLQTRYSGHGAQRSL